MSIINRILTYALGLFLVSSGVAKFTVGHVFQYIEYQSGLDIFYPYVNHAVGAAEIVVGVMILVPATRLLGAMGAVGIMVGAIGFHLSPWLGISMPAGLVDDAAAPWTAADFTTETTSVAFVLAIVTLVRSISIIRTEQRNRTSAVTNVGSGDSADLVTA